VNEILVNTTTSGTQFQPAITSRTGSHYYITWSDSSDSSIKGQILRVDGTRSGDEFAVNNPALSDGNTRRQLPAISGWSQGVVVAWSESPFNPPGVRPRVMMQMLRPNGEPIGGSVQVSTEDTDPDFPPSATGMIDGGFLITWADARQDQRIRAQRFGPDGQKAGAEFTVNTTPGFHMAPIVTRLVDGNAVFVWRSDPSPPGGGAMTFRIFDLFGAPQSEEIVPDISGFGGGKAITPLDNGRFAVAHVRNGTQTPLGVTQSIIEVNVYEPGGSPAGVSLSASNGPGIASSWPTLAPLPGGAFTASWIQKSAETFQTVPQVRAQAFSDSQGSIGEEIQINTIESGDRFQVRAASAFGDTIDPNVFMAWGDDSKQGGDPDEFAVHGRAMRVVNGQLV
jgi:hypothetical protein